MAELFHSITRLGFDCVIALTIHALLGLTHLQEKINWRAKWVREGDGDRESVNVCVRARACVCVCERERNLKVYSGLWGKKTGLRRPPSSGRGGDYEKTHYTNGHGHSPMCNTLRNEKMVWNFLSLSLSLSLSLARFSAQWCQKFNKIFGQKRLWRLMLILPLKRQKWTLNWRAPSIHFLDEKVQVGLRSFSKLTSPSHFLGMMVCHCLFRATT